MDEKDFEQMTPNQKRAVSKGLTALETMASLWAAEVRLSQLALRIAAEPNDSDRAGRIAAMIQQGFIEGAYRHYLDHKDAALPSDAAQAPNSDILDADIRRQLNDELCGFAMRWALDGDYLRCTKCRRAHIASKADMDFAHQAGCKNASTSEPRPWRALLAILSPLYAAPVAPAARPHPNVLLEQAAVTLIDMGLKEHAAIVRGDKIPNDGSTTVAVAHAAAQIDWRELLAAVLRESRDEGGYSAAWSGPENAPGHAHDVAGIWDSDNHVSIAGKPCSWCIAWNAARAALANNQGAAQ